MSGSGGTPKKDEIKISDYGPRPPQPPKPKPTRKQKPKK